MSVLTRILLWFAARLLPAAIRVQAEETAADLMEVANAARKRGLESSLEGLDYANKLPDGEDEATPEGIRDEAKRKVIALFKEATVEQAKTMCRLFDEPTAPADAERALNRPFDDATPTGMSLPDESKAIEQRPSSPGVPSSQPAKKRGRPSNAELARRKAQAVNGQVLHGEGT
jgi:hypothetical protein